MGQPSGSSRAVEKALREVARWLAGGRAGCFFHSRCKYSSPHTLCCLGLALRSRCCVNINCAVPTGGHWGAVLDGELFADAGGRAPACRGLRGLSNPPGKGIGTGPRCLGASGSRPLGACRGAPRMLQRGRAGSGGCPGPPGGRAPRRRPPSLPPTARSPEPARVAVTRLRSESAVVPVPAAAAAAAAGSALPPRPVPRAVPRRAAPPRRPALARRGQSAPAPVAMRAPTLPLCGGCRGHPPAPAGLAAGARGRGRRCVPAGNGPPPGLAAAGRAAAGALRAGGVLGRNRKRRCGAKGVREGRRWGGWRAGDTAPGDPRGLATS